MKTFFKTICSVGGSVCILIVLLLTSLISVIDGHGCFFLFVGWGVFLLLLLLLFRIVVFFFLFLKMFLPHVLCICLAVLVRLMIILVGSIKLLCKKHFCLSLCSLSETLSLWILYTILFLSLSLYGSVFFYLPFQIFFFLFCSSHFLSYTV